MGEVYLAEDSRLHRKLALRILLFEEMITWYKAVFEAKVQYQNPALVFLPYDDEHNRFAFVDMSALVTHMPLDRWTPVADARRFHADRRTTSGFRDKTSRLESTPTAT